MSGNKSKEILPGLSMSNVANAVNGYQTLQDIAYEALRDDILSGKLEPDTPLNSSELSRTMNISRTPIREAINKLISVGLVNQINHKEAKVASFLSDEIHEIFYVRAALEGLAARMSARNMSQHNKEELMELAQKLVDSEKDMTDEEFAEYNKQFHDLIYASIKTPLIKELIEQFYIITKRYRMIGYGVAGRSKNVAEEHFKIAHYILIGDEENAEKYGVLHHLNTINTIDKMK
jgi:DNA-binding GntR family transcriptional regulator